MLAIFAPIPPSLEKLQAHTPLTDVQLMILVHMGLVNNHASVSYSGSFALANDGAATVFSILFF